MHYDAHTAHEHSTECNNSSNNSNSKFKQSSFLSACAGLSCDTVVVH
jgi:hypothetical protein